MMERFTITSSDGKTALAAYRLIPENPRAMVQISHGMCEYFLRYEGFAEYLVSQGFVVFGHDHLGHGNTAPTAGDLGFTASGGGADFLVEDVHNLSLKMKKMFPKLPLILFGHSMGSFIARAVLEHYGSTYRAAVICGTGGPETPAAAGKALASLLMALKGERYRSKFVAGVAFAGYNKKFEKGCDKNAWLTRDAAVVEKYNADPFCTYVFTLRAYHDLFSLVERVSRKEWANQMPKDLPLLVISGEMDPVGGWGKGVRAVADRLQKAGVKDMTVTLYPDMRHEILNETEHEQVWSDISQWMEKRF
ncbi:MAG: lysophospholipase [Clostridia bacterium]|nr:lysophospholipase [Clostridia bacterium]